MIANPAEARRRPASRTGLLGRGLLISAAIFGLLQLWRPCFFLTDDNLSAGFPIFTEIGRHLWHGQSPFVSDYLFGGNYPLIEDPTFFVWHPFVFICSLLAETPAHFWIMDAIALPLLLLATAGFINLAWFVRDELALEVRDGWLLFYALGYTYSFMALASGASWLCFLGNHGAMPWLALGILQRKWLPGLGLVALFSVHQLLGGHFAPLISVSILFSLFAAGVAWWRRSPAPLVAWFGGYVVAVIVILPFLVPAIHGFLDSPRQQGLDVQEMQASRIPFWLFPASFLGGTSFWLIRTAPDFHIFHPALAASAAAWCIFPALLNRRRWHFLEVLCAVLGLVCFFLVIRPLWVSEIMSRLPLLRSLRMPFRELIVFDFFFYFFLVLRVPTLVPILRRGVAVFSATAYLVPMLLYHPPSFNPMAQQRQLLFSGDLDRWWAQVKLHLGPDDRIATVVPLTSYYVYGEWAPFSLIGSHNFCSLVEVTSGSGYSPTAPTSHLYLKTWHPLFGYFYENQVDLLWHERPDLKLIVMTSTHPLRIELRSWDGTAVDLTPYIPSYVYVPAFPPYQNKY
jgi:hypothetical protein